MKPLLNILQKKSFENYRPIWFMRQAGRYLPEYMQVRREIKSFLELCYNPELAAEVTLQPIRRFDLDAAIIFSDILTIPHALGVDVTFVANEGPKLVPVNDINSLNLSRIIEFLQPVYRALELTKKALPENKTLIGFVGSPWTLASYMIEGGGSKDFLNIKKLAFQDDVFFNKLMDILVEACVIHIKEQIKAGAEVIQLFDSWSGALTGNLFYKYITLPNKLIIEKVKTAFPNTPIIAFPKGAAGNYINFANEVGADAISIDQFCDLKYFKDNCRVITQGNLDPALLLTDPITIGKYVDELLEITRNKPHIYNLGHGINKETPIDNVHACIEAIRK